MEYASVEEGRRATGLRLVLTAGAPGPWGEAAKAILGWKGLDYLPVRQVAGEENSELREWTGQASAPVAVYNDEPPVCHWLDLLCLAERLAPERPLLPADPAGRARAIGLSALVAGVEGIGWQRRLQLLAPGMQMPEPPAMVSAIAQRFGWSETAAAEAEPRLVALLAHLDEVLAASEAEGHAYFLGAEPAAPDFYWAAFAGMLRPLSATDCPMDQGLRAMYSDLSPAVAEALTPRLLAHRDRMFASHIPLPMDF